MRWVSSRHSAALFLALTARQSASYVSIDPHQFAFSSSVVSFLETSFRNRTTFLHGLSDTQIESTRNPILLDCSIWSIDGDHQPAQAARDVVAALKASPRVRTILMDDVTDKVTTLQRDTGPLKGCEAALGAWDAVMATTSGSNLKHVCTLSGRKYGTPTWCSAWCIGRRETYGVTVTGATSRVSRNHRISSQLRTP